MKDRLRNVDKIVVVTEEGIAEEGSHDELLTKGGIFANLHRVQFSK
jgi:ATP-binding cassette subfamily B protein